jgi:glycosyltransferase involved in cell wall biosynthesis
VIWLVGDPDVENPSSISKETLGRWHEEGCVRWLGHQKDMKSVWSKAHIAILPSYREGMPMALLEAAACSRPIITTDVSGCNELVTDGVNGLVVPVHDWMAIVDSIELLANSADLRARLGAAARRRVEVEYGEKTVIDQTLALYRKGLCEMRGESDILRNLERS